MRIFFMFKMNQDWSITVMDRNIILDRKGKNLMQISFTYRFLTLILSSVVYLYWGNYGGVLPKMVILCGMAASCFLISYLYQNNVKEKANCLVIILMEVISSSVFIVLSGGAFSPYIWYTISSLILVFMELNTVWVVAAAGTYMVAQFLGCRLYVHKVDQVFLERLIEIGYCTMVACIIGLAYYARHMDDERRKLKFLLMMDNTGEVIRGILKDMLVDLKMDRCIWLRIDLNQIVLNQIFLGFPKELEDIWREKKLLSDWLPSETIPDTIRVGTILFDVECIQYRSTSFGLLLWHRERPFALTARQKESKERYLSVLRNKMEKMDMEDLQDAFVISKEQNRIANEIHDTVLQRLFAISCNAYAIEQEKNGDLDFVKEKIHLLKESIEKTMQELREAIYGICWDKGGDDVLREKIIEYAGEMERLHKIRIACCFEAETNHLTVQQKTALYRIICESVNNGIRHGGAKDIVITVCQNDGQMDVEIKDDGNGIIGNLAQNDRNGHNGLGMKNIYELTGVLKGSVRVESEEGEGVSVKLKFPVVIQAI